MAETTGRVQFLRFLEKRKAITAAALAEIDETTRQFREASAAIALRHHLLNPDQLDHLLLAGAKTDADLLSLAEKNNWISSESHARIRMLQSLREILEICEVLILDGTWDGATVRNELVAFFSESGLGNTK